MSPRTKEKKDKKRKGKKAPDTTPPKTISRDDIESKLKELQGEVDENLESAKSVGLAVGVGAAVVLVLLAYFMGRRRGKKRQLVLEIKRI